MPHKSCPTCQNKLGVRTLKCGCGYVFATAKTGTKQNQPVLAGSGGTLTVAPPKKAIFTINGTIHTPAGSCNIKPASLSKDDIKEWCIKVMQKGESEGKRFAPEALIYFARMYWGVSNEELNQAKTIITEIFRPKQESPAETVET